MVAMSSTVEPSVDAGSDAGVRDDSLNSTAGTAERIKRAVGCGRTRARCLMLVLIGVCVAVVVVISISVPLAISSSTKEQSRQAVSSPTAGDAGSEPKFPELYAWTNWTTCSVSCDTGTQSRDRNCTTNHSSPADEGGCIDGSNRETRNCSNGVICPVDGGWSSWSHWITCSVTCGGGSQSRARSCNNPPRRGSGRDCVGMKLETRNCSHIYCPVDGDWTAWSNWTLCSVTCGGGNQSQSRNCSNPAPQYGGGNCEGQARKVQSCNNFTCPDPCPPTWLLYQGSCYFFDGNEKNWDQARDFCRNKGGYVLVISSDEENQFVYDAARREISSVGSVWLGIKRDPSDNTIFRVVSDGTNSVPTYTKWAPGEPNNPSGEGCGHLYTTGAQLKHWNDITCSAVLGIVCERNRRP